MSEKNDVRLSDEERQPCEIWTRVMGYFRPLAFWNKGKQSEFKERVCFLEEKALKEEKQKTA